MNVKFKDGTIKSCIAPVEQKLLKNSEAAGWILIFNLTGECDSTTLDNILTSENVSELMFVSDDESYSMKLKGYDKISSVFIRHSDSPENTRVEVQLKKGA